MIFLGALDLRLPYADMFVICMAGFLAATVLPETAGKSLPETLADAEKFGRNDKFFSWDAPVFRKKEVIPVGQEVEMDKLNSTETKA